MSTVALRRLRSRSPTIALLDGETVPDRGSRPERALTSARRLLEESGVLAGDVVLISDGGGLDEATQHDAALREARRLTEAGGRVSTLFVPSAPAGGPTAPGRAPLEALAKASGGMSADVHDPFALARRLAERPASRLAESGLSALLWTDYGRYLLLAALLPALCLFRRRR